MYGLFFIALSLATFASSAAAHTIFSCKVLKIDDVVMQAFGDLELEVFHRGPSHNQPKAIVQVQIPGSIWLVIFAFVRLTANFSFYD